MEKIVFAIIGEPIGKERPRFTKKGHAYTPDKTREYESLVASSYLESARKYKFDSPIRVSIMAYFKIPARTSKKVVEDMLHWRILPTKKPDVDNVAKIILDGLNHIAWDDDKQIVELIVAKKYSEEPRVIVAIEKVIARGC